MECGFSKLGEVVPAWYWGQARCQLRVCSRQWGARRSSGGEEKDWSHTNECNTRRDDTDIRSLRTTVTPDARTPLAPYNVAGPSWNVLNGQPRRAIPDRSEYNYTSSPGKPFRCPGGPSPTCDPRVASVGRDFIQLYCKIASRNTNGISEVTGTGEEAGLGLHLCAVQTQTIPIEHVGLYGACCVLR